MQAKSLISSGLLKSGLRRFWPLWVLDLVVFGLLFVMPFWRVLASASDYSSVADQVEAIGSMWHLGYGECLVIAIVGCVIVAVSMNDHLFSPRSATFYGVLPLRRRTVFATNYLGGLLGLVGVLAVVGVALLVLHLISPLLTMRMVGEWFALCLAFTFVFYSLAQLMCQLAGTWSVAVLLYAVINMLAVAIEAAIRWMMSIALYGFSEWETAFDWLSPAVGMAHYGVYGNVEAIESVSWPVVAAYCAAAVVFTIVAGVLHTRRSFEMAGESVAWPALRPVLKYLAGASCALLFASFVCLNNTINARGAALPDMQVGINLGIAMVLGSCVGTLFAELIMTKSTHVLGRTWKGAAILSIASILFVGGVCADALGVASRVPDVSDVESVSIRADGEDLGTYSSAESVQQVVNLHRDIVAYGGENTDEPHNETVVTLAYKLRAGRTMLRTYEIVDGYYTETPVYDDKEDADDAPEGLQTDSVESYEISDMRPATGTPLIEQLAAIANGDEGLRARYRALFDEKARAEMRLSVEYEIGDVIETLAIPAKEANGFLEDAVLPDILHHHAADYDVSYLWREDSSQTELGASVEAIDGNETLVAYVALDTEKTPNCIDWLKRNHPQVKLESASEG